MTEPKLPPWKHRRRLVYGTYLLSVLMVLAAIRAYSTDAQVAIQLIISAAGMQTIILTAYIGGGVIDDRFHFPKQTDQYDYEYTEDEQ